MLPYCVHGIFNIFALGIVYYSSKVDASEKLSTFIEEILKDYNKKVRPFADEGGKVSVTYKIHINAFGSIDALHSRFSMDFVLQQSWIDPRLEFRNKKGSPTHELDFGYERISDVWIPDTYIKNVKEAKRQMVTVPNIRLTVEPAGMVHYSQRLTATMGCEMNLHFYPLDTQTCGIQLESYGHTSDHMVVQWGTENAVEFEDHMKLPEFDFSTLILTYKNCSKTYGISSGYFSCVSLYFTMDRDSSYYIMETFLPTGLVVFASWASFWIDSNAVPARSATALLCLMTLSTKSSGLMQHLPKVGYVKAIDVWMVGCLVFVVLSFVEFVTVNSLNRMERNLKGNILKDKTDMDKGAENGVDTKQPMMRITGAKFENIFRVLYPVSFIIFNLFFWLYATQAFSRD